MRRTSWAVTLLVVSLLSTPLLSADDATPSGSAPDSKAVSEKTSDAESTNKPTEPSEPIVRKLYRGQVVMLREALKKRGVVSFEEFDKQVALQTHDGRLIPIVPDWRGRAFFQDERLRNRDVDLVGYRRKGLPYLQVLMVFTYNEEGERQYTDYWCDICSIPMYEIKPCDCCQADIRLRFQPRDLPEYLNLHSKTSAKSEQPSEDDENQAADP